MNVTIAFSQSPSLAGRPLRIGIVANEPSGDLLGAGLVQAVRGRCPQAQFEGVAGPLMQAQGCISWLPIEQLSVMGLTEVIRHLPRLLRLRRQLAQRILAQPPDIFIGIDAPDFNLGLERRLRAHGINTVHYVSPTVWAWRAGRVKTLRRSADLVLCLFPFEEAFLQRHQVTARYVGHPLAEQIPLTPDRQQARQALSLDPDRRYIALLPGSRLSEVEALAAVFIRTALRVREAQADVAFISPMVNARVRSAFEATWRNIAPDLPIELFDGNSREVLAAANVVLTASGTATLEGLLHKRPMVVAYRLSSLTYWLAKTFKLVKVSHVAMANLLAGDALAPEFIQDKAQPEPMARALLAFLHDPARVAAIERRYHDIHRQMRRGSGDQAAAAVLEWLQANGRLTW
jgi:lipid-A-disaccharide synthase